MNARILFISAGLSAASSGAQAQARPVPPVSPSPAAVPAPVAAPRPAQQVSPRRTPRPVIAPVPGGHWLLDDLDPLLPPGMPDLVAPVVPMAPMLPGMPTVAPWPPEPPDMAGPEWEALQDRLRDARWEVQERLGNSQWEMQERIRERQSEIRWDMERRQAEVGSRIRDQEFAIRDAMRDIGARLPTLARSWSPGDERGIATMAPSPWRASDQADSVYRAAREMLNRGEYRRAAAMFSDIVARHPNSVYAPDALYWNAFSLYRIGGTPDLRGALEALESQRAKYPNARTQSDARTLATRIRGALAARGDAAAAAEIRGTANDSALRCDREEQTVRMEALKALTESDPEGAMPVLQRTLSRKDDCSANLRNTAVFIVGSRRRDAAAVTLLSQVARTDPSVEVRGSALEWLARMPGDDALATIEALSRDTTEERIQRAAVRALVVHPSARARQLVRTVIERAETPERLRLEALGAFDKERSSPDDVTWLRGLYGRVDNPRVKSRIVSALTRIGGPDVDQWLLTIARNADEDSETRAYALRRVAETQPIVELGRLYDAAAQRTVRESIIEALGKRTEAEATDKLIEIVKNGTDPQLRSRAIGALSRKKDPRTMQLLMELVSK